MCGLHQLLVLTPGLGKAAGTLDVDARRAGKGQAHPLGTPLDREEVWQAERICPGFPGKSECENSRDHRGETIQPLCGWLTSFSRMFSGFIHDSPLKTVTNNGVL